ncbi:MAG: hypothetical protein SGARI_006442 [Bacillariaceae sp.]
MVFSFVASTFILLSILGGLPFAAADGGIRGETVQSRQLNPNYSQNGKNKAITMWWVIFNNPAACQTPFACAVADVGAAVGGNSNPAQIGVAFATGGVTDKKGFLRLVASTYTAKDGELDLVQDDSVVPPDGVGSTTPHYTFGSPTNLKTVYNAPGQAQVAIVIRTHGQAADDTGDLLAQLTRFTEGLCDQNGCADIGLAAFGDVVSDGYYSSSIGCFPPSCGNPGQLDAAIPENTATLIRTGDALQVVDV